MSSRLVRALQFSVCRATWNIQELMRVTYRVLVMLSID